MSEITELMILCAYNEYADESDTSGLSPFEMLNERSGQPMEQCISACRQAYNNNLIDFGVTLEFGWLSEKGALKLNELMNGKGAHDYAIHAYPFNQ